MSRLAALTVSLLSLILLAAPAAGAAERSERWTPVVAGVVDEPEPVLATDGRVHLAYELLLINRSFNPPAKVSVTGIQARAGGRVVGALSGERLAAVMVRMSTAEPGVELAPGEAAYALMDVTFKQGTKLPRQLNHRISIAVEPPNPTVATAYAAAPTGVVARPAVVIAPPLRGDGWVVTNGCCAELTSHRSALLPVNGGLAASERFAIDFIQLRPNGMIADGPYDQLTSYPFFGDEVLSVAAGKVVTVVDRYPETPPGDLPPTSAEAAGGNHVVVAIGGGRYAFYAHLQPGSARVEVGDEVKAGQPIGRLGSTGNSNLPHLHFHVMDGPLPLASEGVPYRFSRFSLAGKLTNFPALFEDRPAQIAPPRQAQRKAQLPLNLQVIGFG